MKVNKDCLGSNRHNRLVSKCGGRKLRRSRLIKKYRKAWQDWFMYFTISVSGTDIWNIDDWDDCIFVDG